MKTDPLQVLAKMGEVNAEATTLMLDLVMAVCLDRFGETSITFDRNDMIRVAERYKVNRTVDDAGHWRVSIRPIGDAAQAQLPLTARELEGYPANPFAEKFQPFKSVPAVQVGEQCFACGGVGVHMDDCPSKIAAEITADPATWPQDVQPIVYASDERRPPMQSAACPHCGLVGMHAFGCPAAR